MYGCVKPVKCTCRYMYSHVNVHIFTVMMYVFSVSVTLQNTCNFTNLIRSLPHPDSLMTTTSSASGLEARIRALKEQLRQRKEEVKKVQNEQRRKKKAILKQQEEQLKKKLEVSFPE